MNIVKLKDVKIEDVIAVLENGGLVIYPTETLYGIAVDATNLEAVKKLTKYKKRPVGKPYSIAVSDISMANNYVYLNSSAKNIYSAFLPGPITVVSKGKHKVAKGVESETGTLGVRMPDYKPITDIIKKFNKPITATSANASYKKRPYKISDIFENISLKQKSLIDLVIDAGELPHHEPSTVVDTTIEDTLILRQGEIKFGKENKILSRSEEDTKNLAKELFQKNQVHAGQRAIVFALKGDMGAGKTIFTKGLGKAIGVNDIITSPTYNLINSYKSSNGLYKLVHIDAWRLNSVEEISDINLQKEISDGSIVSIEWSDKIAEEIRKYNEDAIIIWVNIIFGKKPNERTISWGTS